MRIVLEHDGWRKELDVSTDVHNQGIVKVAIRQPMQPMFDNMPEHGELLIVVFIRSDDFTALKGTPIYRWEG